MLSHSSVEERVEEREEGKGGERREGGEREGRGRGKGRKKEGKGRGEGREREGRGKEEGGEREERGRGQGNNDYSTSNISESITISCKRILTFELGCTLTVQSMNCKLYNIQEHKSGVMCCQGVAKDMQCYNLANLGT